MPLFSGAVYCSLSAFPGTASIAQKGTIRTKDQLPMKVDVSGAERFGNIAASLRGCPGNPSHDALKNGENAMSGNPSPRAGPGTWKAWGGEVPEMHSFSTKREYGGYSGRK
ncbi:hypothetical protein [Streptosporangium subroseum]|uniref:hypothetical protein n=1 Tax=Streptosporangium subroseum TaxID=106412 RepID=UPI00308D6617|nr:hypothetical protein OHB15_01710 [Streptosporangium subroseum]